MLLAALVEKALLAALLEKAHQNFLSLVWLIEESLRNRRQEGGEGRGGEERGGAGRGGGQGEGRVYPSSRIVCA